MSQDLPTPPLALIYETSDGAAGSIAAGLVDLGWRVRTVSGGAGTAPDVPADLWVVGLASGAPDPLDLLRSLPQAGAKAPLLVVADGRDLPEYAAALVRLPRAWPCPVDLLVRPYSQAELRMRVRFLVVRGARARRGGPIPGRRETSD